MNTNFTAVPDWFPEENAGAGIAVADINGNGLADVVVFMVDDSPAQNAGYFRVGWGRDDQCTVGEWTTWTAVPDWNPWFNEGAGIAVADISGSGAPTRAAGAMLTGAAARANAVRAAACPASSPGPCRRAFLATACRCSRASWGRGCPVRSMSGSGSSSSRPGPPGWGAPASQ